MLAVVLFFMSICIYLSLAESDEAVTDLTQVAVAMSKSEVINSDLSSTKTLTDQAIESSLNTRNDYDLAIGHGLDVIKDKNNIDQYSAKDLYHVSEKMEPIYFAHPGILDVLTHINLMHGNSITDEDLIGAISNEKSPYHKEAVARMGFKYGDPDRYEALIRFEKEIIGELIESPEIENIINTQRFKDYMQYLINDEIIIPFCTSNPNSLSCEKSHKSKAEITKY